MRLNPRNEGMPDVAITRSGGLRDYFDHPAHGPLPALLLLLTIGTGLVDAISILGLGRVFVANMTGNIVFVGFAWAGAPGYTVKGSLVALAAFLGGAWGGGVVVSHFGFHRGKVLRNALALQLVLFLVALGVSATGATPLPTARQLAILASAALALGMQNAVVRFLAVPDLTTTVLTMTLTGIGSDLRHGDLKTALRRLIAVLSMLAGAAVGTLLVLHLGLTLALVAVAVVFALALLGAALASRGTPGWSARPATT